MEGGPFSRLRVYRQRTTVSLRDTSRKVQTQTQTQAHNLRGLRLLSEEQATGREGLHLYGMIPIRQSVQLSRSVSFFQSTVGPSTVLSLIPQIITVIEDLDALPEELDQAFEKLQEAHLAPSTIHSKLSSPPSTRLMPLPWRLGGSLIPQSNVPFSPPKGTLYM
jgi:hypothetical protein